MATLERKPLVANPSPQDGAYIQCQDASIFKCQPPQKGDRLDGLWVRPLVANPSPQDGAHIQCQDASIPKNQLSNRGCLGGLWVRPLCPEILLVSSLCLRNFRSPLGSAPLSYAGMLWQFQSGLFSCLLDLFDNPGISRVTAFTISTSSDFYCHRRVFVYHYSSYHLGTLIDYHV